MSPRSTPKKKLTRSPLVLVLCEVKFAPVLSMSEYVPAIQNKLRRSGFPGFEVAQIQNIEFTSPTVPPKISALSRWSFQSSDGNSSVILTTESFAIQTTVYDDFESFI